MHKRDRTKVSSAQDKNGIQEKNVPLDAVFSYTKTQENLRCVF